MRYEHQSPWHLHIIHHISLQIYTDDDDDDDDDDDFDEITVGQFSDLSLRVNWLY